MSLTGSLNRGRTVTLKLKEVKKKFLRSCEKTPGNEFFDQVYRIYAMEPHSKNRECSVSV